jgi:rubrerythrin
MSPFLAQLSPGSDPTAVGSWVLILGAILAILCSAAYLWTTFRAKPAAHEVYATKAEVAEIRAAVVTQLSDIRREIEEQRRASSVSRSRIYESIEAIGRDVASQARDIRALEEWKKDLREMIVRENADLTRRVEAAVMAFTNNQQKH